MSKVWIVLMLLIPSIGHADQAWEFAQRWQEMQNQWASAGLNEGLVSYYAMRSSGTTVVDEWGTNTATGAAGVIFGSAYGVRDDGAEFNGTDGELRIPPLLIGNLSASFSISLWARINTSASRQYFIGFGNSATTEPLAGINYDGSGQAEFVVRQSSGPLIFALAAGGTVATNTFYHYVLTWDAATKIIRGYLDGVNVASATNAFLVGGAVFNSARIGRLVRTSAVFPTDGSIDEAAIWTRALSSNEVYKVYNTTLYAPYKD
jgi:hypothetical protein